jgi:hypothetical protein
MEFYSNQIQIVRQSQIKLAFDYVTSLGIQVSVEELQRITDVFVEYCIRPADEDLKNRVRKMDEWLLKVVKEKRQMVL